MPRAARKKSISGIYHVIIRGNNQCIIFYDQSDYYHFLKRLQSVKEKTDFQLYAYCLMGNHVHLLIKEGKEPLEIVFKRLGTSYVQYFNLKYQRHGHLFQDRFLSENVEDNPYFWDVLRYICQNPVKAGLSSTPFDYPWLGCWEIAGDDKLLDKHEYFDDIGIDRLRSLVSIPCKNQHLENDTNHKLTDAEAMELIRDKCGCSHTTEIANWTIKMRDDAVRKSVRAGLSYRQLARLTGISKTVIERIMKNK